MATFQVPSWQHGEGMGGVIRCCDVTGAAAPNRSTGLDLTYEYFSRGQLYVGMSRAMDPSKLYVVADENGETKSVVCNRMQPRSHFQATRARFQTHRAHIQNPNINLVHANEHTWRDHM